LSLEEMTQLEEQEVIGTNPSAEQQGGMY